MLLEAVICWGTRCVLITSSLMLGALTAGQGAHASLLTACVGWNEYRQSPGTWSVPTVPDRPASITSGVAGRRRRRG